MVSNVWFTIIICKFEKYITKYENKLAFLANCEVTITVTHAFLETINTRYGSRTCNSISEQNKRKVTVGSIGNEIDLTAMIFRKWHYSFVGNTNSWHYEGSLEIVWFIKTSQQIEKSSGENTDEVVDMIILLWPDSTKHVTYFR